MREQVADQRPRVEEAVLVGVVLDTDQVQAQCVSPCGQRTRQLGLSADGGDRDAEFKRSAIT
ncbi:MAG: hypothetical protein HZY76_14745 [Anaerolineae bacterium]|nr:MAG: hypothetical protein HZY76_14745 [Anaerolineae bacterium]